MMDPQLLVNPDVDFNKAPPIQQKRIIAFINHFIMNTVSFLNTFAQSCESRLMEFEFKLNKVDASLKILESQLSSIPDENLMASHKESNPEYDLVEIENFPVSGENPNTETNPLDEIPQKPKYSEDPLYSKYFKMVQVGVPVEGVKLKMRNDGLNPDILNEL